MVTEGGLYILTLFDDFGGTYGKSIFGLVWFPGNCVGVGGILNDFWSSWIKIFRFKFHSLISNILKIREFNLPINWGFNSSTRGHYWFLIFSTFGLINYRNVGDHVGLWIGQFLPWHSINVETRCSYLLENLLAICLPSITFICIGSNNGIMEKIVTWWRRIPSMDECNCSGTYFLINSIHTWNGHSSYCQKGWNKSKFLATSMLVTDVGDEMGWWQQ